RVAVVVPLRRRVVAEEKPAAVHERDVRRRQLERHRVEERDVLAGLRTGNHIDASTRAGNADTNVSRADRRLIEIQDICGRVEGDRLSIGQRTELVDRHCPAYCEITSWTLRETKLAVCGCCQRRHIDVHAMSR